MAHTPWRLTPTRPGAVRRLQVVRETNHEGGGLGKFSETPAPTPLLEHRQRVRSMSRKNSVTKALNRVIVGRRNWA
jgi:hypothetical protein